MYIVYLSPIAWGAILLLIYFFMTVAYEGAVNFSAALENILPIIGGILFAILLVISIVSAVKKQSFLHGFVMVLSWTKTIIFNLISAYAMVVVVQAAGNVFLALFVVPLSAIVVCGPVGFELSTTISAWTKVSEYDSLRPAVIQLIVSCSIFAALCVVATFL